MAWTRRDLALSCPMGLAKYHLGDAFEDTPLIRALNRAWLDAFHGRIHRDVIVAPPRHGKTMGEQYGTAWWLHRQPMDRGAYSTYAGSLAKDFGAKTRQIIRDTGHLTGIDIDPGTSAKHDWALVDAETQEPLGGGLFSGGRGGAFMGKGFKFGIGDDYYSGVDEARSQAINRQVWTFASDTFPSRLEANAPLIFTNTRWTDTDHIGRLYREKKDLPGWRFTRIPALADHLAFDGRGKAEDHFGRSLNEPLWATRWTREVLETIKEDRGPTVWAGTYQGLPSPPEGAMFRRAWFNYWTWANKEQDAVILGRLGAVRRVVPLSECRIFHTMDTAGKDEHESTDADFTVLSTWALTQDHHLILLNVERIRTNPVRHAGLVKKAYEAWGGVTYLEETLLSLSVNRELNDAGVPVRSSRPDKSKTSRATLAEARYSAGRVWHPDPATVRAPWLHDFEDELLFFPNGEHDDQVDTVSLAALQSRPRRPPGIRDLGA